MMRPLHKRGLTCLTERNQSCRAWERMSKSRCEFRVEPPKTLPLPPSLLQRCSLSTGLHARGVFPLPSRNANLIKRMENHVQESWLSKNASLSILMLARMRLPLLRLLIFCHRSFLQSKVARLEGRRRG
jgi:hypothetical protein